jgi:streptogramin lyase
MVRAALLLLLAIPLLAQSRPGVTRVPFPADGPQRDPASLVLTADSVLWAASATNGVLDRIVAGGASSSFELPHWGGTQDLTVGPDGAVWIAARHYVARHDPATNALRRWTQYRDATHIETGSDGNLWFIHKPSYDFSRLVRMTPAGVELSNFILVGNITGAVFASDGAMWTTRREAGNTTTVVRVDAHGATRTYPLDFYGRLFAAPGFLWVAGPDRILRIGFDSTTLDSYALTMSAEGVDAHNGNLWLRARTELGEEVGRLTPLGVLTRFGPVEPLPSGNCPHTQSVYGGFAVAPDGRVAMTDYYPLYGYIPEHPCASEELPDAQNTLTVLDPSVAPVIEVRSLNPRVRRRAGRS